MNEPTLNKCIYILTVQTFNYTSFIKLDLFFNSEFNWRILIRKFNSRNLTQSSTRSSTGPPNSTRTRGSTRCCLEIHPPPCYRSVKFHRFCLLPPFVFLSCSFCFVYCFMFVAFCFLFFFSIFLFLPFVIVSFLILAYRLLHFAFCF